MSKEPELKIQLLTTFVCLFVSVLKTQTLNDPIYVNYQHVPSSLFIDSSLSQTTNFIEMNATTPGIRLGSKSKLYNSAYFRYTDISYSKDFSTFNNHFIEPSSNLYTKSLVDIRYSLILRVEFNSSWEAVAISRILLRSNFRNEMSNRDFVPYAVLLANYSINKNPNFKIGLGVALNNDFSPNAIIPTGTLFYNGRKLKIEIAYPSATFLYKYSKDFEFGIYSNLDAAITHIYLATPSSNHAYLRSMQFNISPTVSHRIYKNFFGHLKVGYAMLRKMELLDENHQPLRLIEQNINPSLFFKLGISYRMNE